MTHEQKSSPKSGNSHPIASPDGDAKASSDGDADANANASASANASPAPYATRLDDSSDMSARPDAQPTHPDDHPVLSSSAARDAILPGLPARTALLLGVVVTAAVAFALRYAFAAEQAGSWQMLAALFGVYVPFALVAVVLVARDRKLTTELRPHRGDLSFGAIIAGLMYGAVMAGRLLFLGADTPRTWWIARIYLQLGDRSGNRMLYVGGAIFVIAALEELVWRGLVMRALRPSLGPMRAWLLSSVLYAVAHVTTVQLLAHPVAGPNPLLVAAALACGLVWGHLYNRTGRLAPCLFAHGLFSWAIVDFPLWRP